MKTDVVVILIRMPKHSASDEQNSKDPADDIVWQIGLDICFRTSTGQV